MALSFFKYYSKPIAWAISAHSNFEGLLKRDGSVSIHHQNIKFLAIEMFKVFKGKSSQNVWKCNALPIKKTDRFSNPIYLCIVFSVSQNVWNSSDQKFYFIN